ncbi:hypothetical protein KP509_21G041500 [Ceratopteris richardii]|nr:hypothetical protein KP509_21G041500 [Ceratopteris richardii]KAH7315255.1 hypothetical protein KP509_21G041500 [Ceratopteris richardii]KAH7315256.1 hypothetical protein KP509_21G041500 [Ceratopteris richardii]KAH7315257.1 hypothetical protein KP509_21G041500 [Ceratopteris richardii]KAH7315258.1 hypothetical protein KP509_21G041500 [Ceratopteris richardii]
MGAKYSKEELLYQEVQNGNHDAVKSLHQEGASLEWVDKEGRTPLILACTRGELLDMVITLLNLGAHINAYRPGAHGGSPLHHAAKRGLEKTATLLLSYGANPLALNDDGCTPLDLARSRGHAMVVRLLEERLCIFSGILREISGFGILESIAPKLLTKKVWAVVLLARFGPQRTAVYELAIYESPKVSLWNGIDVAPAHPAGLCNVAQPRSKIALASAEIEEPNFTLVDPVLYIMDKVHKTKYKFYAGNKGDKYQLERLYRACKGMSLTWHGSDYGNSWSVNTADYPGAIPSHNQGNLSQIYPIWPQTSTGSQPMSHSLSALSPGLSSSFLPDTSAVEPISEELALALALDESIRTAAEEGIPVSPTTDSIFSVSRQNYWTALNEREKEWETTDVDNNLQRENNARYGGWSAELSSDDSWHDATRNAQTTAPPSAPPLAEVAGCAPINDGTGGMCVVCWDAHAEGVCIPCGHLAGCMSCLIEVKSKNPNCPLCRGHIEQVIKVYTV